MQTSKFCKGDYVVWKNPIHGEGKWRIVDVWDDPYVPRLLLTDLRGDTGTCHTALQCDCEVVQSS